MINLTKNLIPLILVCLLIISCSEDEPRIIGLTEEEAAEEVSSLLIGDVNGIAGDIRGLAGAATRKSNAGRTECGVLFDTLINYDYAGPNIQFDLEFSYNYGLNCSNNIPEQLTFDFSTASNYDGPRIARTGESSGSATADGLRLLDTQYDLNASFESSSTINQKERDQKTFSGESTVTLTNLLIDKTTFEIQSGEATIISTGTNSDNETYQFNASVTYQGDGVALVMIQERQFSIDLTTGEITEQ